MMMMMTVPTIRQVRTKKNKYKRVNFTTYLEEYEGNFVNHCLDAEFIDDDSIDGEGTAFYRAFDTETIEFQDAEDVS